MTNNHLKTVCCGLFLSGVLLAAPMPQATSGSSPSADNTRVNKQDRKDSAPTADKAKSNANDRELMRQIRRDVVSDKSLSTYAHNVKIIAQGGKVTLRGVVHSEEEKKTIEDLARKRAGEDNVNNELSVKAADSK